MGFGGMMVKYIHWVYVCVSVQAMREQTLSRFCEPAYCNKITPVKSALSKPQGLLSAFILVIPNTYVDIFICVFYNIDIQYRITISKCNIVCE